jgi:hypothetical protein
MSDLLISDLLVYKSTMNIPVIEAGIFAVFESGVH